MQILSSQYIAIRINNIASTQWSEVASDDCGTSLRAHEGRTPVCPVHYCNLRAQHKVSIYCSIQKELGKHVLDDRMNI